MGLRTLRELQIFPQGSKDLVGILTSLPCLGMSRSLSVLSAGIHSDNTSKTSALKEVVHTGFQAWTSSAQPAESVEVITSVVTVEKAERRSSHIKRRVL
jgi:hypothetical protein